MKLKEGAYENLINGHTRRDIEETEANGAVCQK